MIVQTEPVTVVVRHRVRRGKQREFEEWLRGITTAMLRFEGQQGYSVVRPGDSRTGEYLVFFRFDSFQNLEQWENSKERREWLRRLEELFASTYTRQQHTGLEVWFDPPAGGLQPRRWKMIVITLLAIYPLVSLMQLAVVPHLPDLPFFVRTAVTSTILCLAMTYVVMPFMTWLFSPWLYGRAAK